jgi:hypothetical protein
LLRPRSYLGGQTSPLNDVPSVVEQPQRDSSIKATFDERVIPRPKTVAIDQVPESTPDNSGISRVESNKDNHAPGQDVRSTWQSWLSAKMLSCLSWLKVFLTMQD